MWLFERVIDPRRRSTLSSTRACGQRRAPGALPLLRGLPKRFGADAGGRRPARRDDRVHARMPGRGDRGRRPARPLRARPARARGDARARPRALRPAGAGARLPLVPRRFEVAFGTQLAPRSSCSAASSWAASPSPGRSTGSTLDPFSARGIVQDYKLGRASAPARSRPRGSSRSRSTCSRCATSSGWSRSAASTAPRRGAGGARARARRRPRGRVPGVKRAGLLSRGRVLAQVDARRRARAGRGGAGAAGRRAPRSAGRRVPDAGATAGRCAG